MIRAGFLNIHKPTGVTSRDAVNAVCKVVGTKRVGHAGTLDPLATGVLVVAIERATRLVEYVQAQPKTYVAEFLFGQTSTTDDVEGEVTPHTVAQIPTETELHAALSEFVGEIQQTPPQFSAVKVAGKRAYAEAREGRPVEIAARSVTVHSIAVLTYDFPRVRLRIECGSGTYIRSIARDLGAKLGVGGLMSALARTAVGVFRLEDAVALAELTKENWPSHLRPLADAVGHLPRLDLDATQTRAFQLGQRFAHPAEKAEEAAAFSEGEFLGIASAEATGLWKPAKGGFADRLVKPTPS